MLNQLLSSAALAGRICAGLVFALAALDKMRHWRVLEGVIGNYRLLPSRLVRPAAYVLPPVELALAAALLSGIMILPAAAAAMTLLLIFALAMAINIRRGRDFIDCGCHQSFLRQTLKPALVARNLLLTALLSVSLASPLMPPAGPATIGVAAGLALFLLYLIANTVIALPVLNTA
jgi:uncharacterized membrane protein YphA (DoxX/SURF4 family)